MEIFGYTIIESSGKNIDYDEENGTIIVPDDECILTFYKGDNNINVHYGKVQWCEYKDLSNIREIKINLYIEQNLLPTYRELCIIFTNKQTGDNITFFIKQKECFYNIECKIDEVSFVERETPIEIRFKVYGNTKKCNISDDNFSIIKENNKYYPFDRGISYKLKKIPKNEINYDIDEEQVFEEYGLVINYVGNISDLNENDKYSVILQHADNRQTRKIVDIGISSVLVEGDIENKLDNLFNNKENKTIPSAISVYEEENNSNRTTKYNIPKTIQKEVILRNNSANIQPVVKLPSLVLDRIEDNTIYIQSNTYNKLNKIEHNSLIIGTKMANWCTIDDIYNNQSKIHEITVTCKTNRFGIERKSYVVLINAERPEGQKKFLVTQDKENKISIIEI